MPPANRKYRRVKASGPDTSTWTESERQEKLQQERLQTPVAEMVLTVRIVNTLENNDVLLAQDLVAQTYESLMKMKNFGETALKEVREAIVALGLTPPEWKKPPKSAKSTKPPGKPRSIIDIW